MPDRSKDWLAQALHTIAQAARMAEAGAHDWSCFMAQQAAEAAVKALHLHHKQDAWGHSVRVLLEELPAPVRTPAELIEAGRVLDNYYIPARYPNGHESGAPKDHYGPRQSGEAMRCAREIIEFCRLQMAGS